MNKTKQSFVVTALLAASSISFGNAAPIRKAKPIPTMEDSALPYCKITDANRKSLKGNISKRLETLFTAIKNQWGIPPALIFHGQKGVGKTLSALALAGELDGYFMHFKVEELLDQGNCKFKIKRVFKHARKCVRDHHKYTIIFFDDIHLLGKKGYRSSDMQNFVNTLTNEIMNEDDNRKILVIAATYEPGEEIANLFTKEPFQAVEFTIPDEESRQAILMHYFAESLFFNKKLHEPMIANLAIMAYDLTPRDLKGLVVKAESSLGQRHKNSKYKTKQDMAKHKFTQEDFDSARKSTNTMKVKEDGSFSWTRVAEGSVVATVGAAVGFVIAIIAGSNGGNGGK